MTGYVSKKLLGAARLPDTPSARAYLDKVLEEDDDIQMYKKPWVDLTDEDVAEVERWVAFKEEGSGRIPTGKLVAYINNKLKERNT